MKVLTGKRSQGHYFKRHLPGIWDFAPGPEPEI